MSNVLLKFNSTQIFEQHVDNISEEHMCNVDICDKGFEISYECCNIKLFEEKLTIDKEFMKLEIEIAKRNFSKMVTPYGQIDIEVEGKKLNWTQKPFSLKTSYNIKLGNTSEYVNELEIVVVDK